MIDYVEADKTYLLEYAMDGEQEYLDLRQHGWRFVNAADRTAADKAAADKAAADRVAADKAAADKAAQGEDSGGGATEVDDAGTVVAAAAEGADGASTAADSEAAAKMDTADDDAPKTGAPAAQPPSPVYSGAQAMYARMRAMQQAGPAKASGSGAAAVAAAGGGTEAGKADEAMEDEAMQEAGKADEVMEDEAMEEAAPPPEPAIVGGKAKIEAKAAESEDSDDGESGDEDEAERKAEERREAEKEEAQKSVPERDWRAEGPRVETAMSLNTIKAALPISEKEVGDFVPPAGWVQHSGKGERARIKVAIKWVRLGSAADGRAAAVDDREVLEATLEREAREDGRSWLGQMNSDGQWEIRRRAVDEAIDAVLADLVAAGLVRAFPGEAAGKGAATLYCAANRYERGEAFPVNRGSGKAKEEKEEEADEDLCDFELERKRNIERNKQLLRELGLL